MSRFKESNTDIDAAIRDAIAKDIHRSAVVQLLRQPSRQSGLGPLGVPTVRALGKLVKLLELRRIEKREQLFCVQSQHGVEIVCDRIAVVSVRGEPSFDGVFKCTFVGVGCFH